MGIVRCTHCSGMPSAALTIAAPRIPIAVRCVKRILTRYNIVGNVLGTTSAAFRYQEASPQCCDDLYIYNLGQAPGSRVAMTPPWRPRCFAGANYDTATGTVRFLSSDVPTTGSAHQRKCCSRQSEPTQLVFLSQPADFPGRLRGGLHRGRPLDQTSPEACLES